MIEKYPDTVVSFQGQIPGIYGMSCISSSLHVMRTLEMPHEACNVRARSGHAHRRSLLRVLYERCLAPN